MNLVPAPHPPDKGWRLQFRHAGKWYQIGKPIPTFAEAWAALNLLHKSDADHPVERRIVKTFIDRHEPQETYQGL